MTTTENIWWLYLLDCDGRLYTGISTDPERRYQEHLAGGAKGARFTRSATRIALLWHLPIGDRSLALRAEHRLKRLPRARKLALVSLKPDTEALLQQLALA